MVKKQQLVNLWQTCRHGLVLLGMCLLLSSCGSSPFSSYYTLEATAFRPDIAVQGGPVIAIDSAVLPSSISRDKLIKLEPSGKASIQEYKRWLDAPDKAVVQIMAANLSSQIPSERIVIHPWRPTRSIDYTLSFNLFEFGLQADGNVSLSVFWSLVDKDKQLRVFRRSAYSLPLSGDGKDIEQSVPVLSQIMGLFSNDVAKAIQALGRADNIPPGRAVQPVSGSVTEAATVDNR